MPWAAFYGIMVCSAVLISAWSHHAATMKFAGLLMLSWVSSNAAVNYLGFHHAPDVIPEADAAIALVLGTIALSCRSCTGLLIFVMFVAEAAIDVMAWTMHTEGDYGYYAVLNVIFALQVLTVGVAGIVQGIRYWSSRGHTFPHHSSRRSEFHVAGVAEWWR